MPYSSKRSSRRYRRSRRLPTGGRRVNFKQTKAIVGLQKKMKQISRCEPKFSNLSIAETTLVNGTPKSHILNGMSIGDSNLFRDASRLRWKYIDLRGYVKTTSSLTAHTLVRFVLVIHKDTNGVAMSTKLDDLFVRAEVDDATPDGLSMYNWMKGDWNKHFKVLWDTGALVMGPNSIDYTSATGHTTAHPHERVLRFRKRINVNTIYGLADGGGVTDIASNAFHLIAFSDTATANAIQYYFESMMVGSEII